MTARPAEVQAAFRPVASDPLPAGLVPARSVGEDVRPGPVLLSGVGRAPDLGTHRELWGELPRAVLADLLADAAAVGLRGRGGAGFPFWRKLEAASRGRRPLVVVNAAEGEPASAKDSGLLRTSPHLVLDGAALVAAALGTREVHVVTSEDRPHAGGAVADALAERRVDGPGRFGGGVRWRHHVAAGRFVAGQARAVIELLSGREGLPVTAWEPEAVRGHRGRPTLLSNAETFAHLAVLARRGVGGYASRGTVAEPGTTLLTIGRRVVEAEHGQVFAELLHPAEAVGSVLVGGFHGSWVRADVLAPLPVSDTAMRARGLGLGAGVLVPLGSQGCPVAVTAAVVDYLAAQSARRCGPCRNGLPALADELAGLAAGRDTRLRIEQLVGLVDGRGACAHPDGTVRLVRSLLVLPGGVDDHLAHRCGCAPSPSGAP